LGKSWGIFFVGGKVGAKKYPTKNPRRLLRQGFCGV